MAINNDSDTESESQASVYGWDATDFVQLSATQALCSSQDSLLDLKVAATGVHNAIADLRSLDMNAVEYQVSLHDVIQRASTAILSFLGGIELSPLDRETEMPMSALLDQSFVSLLFAYRQIFHGIAARDVVNGTSPTVVCWVDVILARLGEAIVLVAGGVDAVGRQEEAVLSSLEKQREGDALRAATQLPGKWDAVANVLCAEHASPAAVRLALRLLFGVFVMGPQLTDASPCQEQSWKVDLMHTLKSHIDRISPAEDQSVAPYPGVSAGLQERESYAMFLSLFAVVDCIEHEAYCMSFRPHTQATLLRFIMTIMYPTEVPSSALQPVTPYASLDTAQVILLKYGQTISWCWSKWEDPRIAHSEVVDLMTVTWLYHIGDPFDDVNRDESTDTGIPWDEELTSTLALNPEAAATAIIRFLNHVVVALLGTPSIYLCSASQDVTYKGCWAAMQLLNASRGDADSLTSQLCSVLCKLFVLLRSTHRDHAVKDLLIESLSIVRAEALRSAMHELCKDVGFKLATRLEEKISNANRLFRGGKLIINLSHEDISAIRQVLQFSALIWHADVHDCFSGSGLSELLVLRDSLISLLAISETLTSKLFDKHWEDESIWQIAIEGGSTDLTTASAFAAYISATAHHQRCDRLTYVEAWDYLRDVLLLVLSHHFLDTEEPLAVLVAPLICQALTYLIKYADVQSVQSMLSSPWTVSLCRELQGLAAAEDSDSNQYHSQLRARLSSYADALLKAISTGVLAGDRDDTLEPMRVSSRLLLCEVYSVPHLLMVAECF